MKNEEYQGWVNYETWATYLWIGNDYDVYKYMRKHTPYTSEECNKFVKEDLENFSPITYNGLIRDIGIHGLSKVDWDKICEAVNE